MSDLIQKLGIEWNLLIAQAVNFLIVLAVLWLTAYKPIVRMLRERKERIEKGIHDADRAAERLADADDAYAARVNDAEKRSIAIIRETEERAKEHGEALAAQIKEKEKRMVEEAERKVRGVEAEGKEALAREAASLVRAAIARVAEKDPATIDGALIAQALEAAKQQQAS